MAAKAFGAGKVAVVDMNEGNLEVARQMGADIGILSGRTESPIAVGERIKSVLGPDGPGVVIDCAGFEATMQACATPTALPAPCLTLTAHMSRFSVVNRF